MADALHRDDGVRYPATLQVPHYTFDPSMHLRMKSMTHVQPCVNPALEFTAYYMKRWYDDA